MKHLSLTALLAAGLLVTSCGGSVTVSTNMNSDMQMNTNAMAVPPSETGTGTTTSAGSSFTAAQVATHNKEGDCYAIVGSDVYDLTQWVNMHPGGPEAILGTCGKDLTNFTHPGGTPMTEQVKNIPQFKIGTLAQ